MIHLVRHGEAAGAEGDDPGLSAAGRQQVADLARRLIDRSVSAIWHGPRRRTTETARLLAARLRVNEVVRLNRDGLVGSSTVHDTPGCRRVADQSDAR